MPSRRAHRRVVPNFAVARQWRSPASPPWPVRTRRRRRSPRRRRNPVASTSRCGLPATRIAARRSRARSRTSTSRAATARGASTPKAPTPAGFPRVDPETQKGRDGVRRKVLADELATEEKLLAETRVAYADGAPAPLPEERADAEKYRARISRLRQSMTRAREEHRGAEEGARRRQVSVARRACATGRREYCCGMPAAPVSFAPGTRSR